MDTITLLDFERYCRDFKIFHCALTEEFGRKLSIEISHTYSSVCVRSAPDKITFRGEGGQLSIIRPVKLTKGVNEFGDTYFNIETKDKNIIRIIAI